MMQSPSDEAIRAKLDELIASEPNERKSKLAATLDPYREQITKALAKGHTFRTLAGALRDGGITISPETIRRYVQRTNGNKTKRTARRRVPTRASAPSVAIATAPKTIEQLPTPTDQQQLRLLKPTPPTHERSRHDVRI